MKAIILLLATLLSLSAIAQNLSPRSFGLDTATTNESRYRVLFTTHTAALQQGVDVSYAGIDTLTIAVPHDAKSIPLTRHNDFGGLVLYVHNSSHHLTIFSKTQSRQPIDLSAEAVDKGDFQHIDALAKGDYLVVLQDKHPWVAERIGYAYPAMRSDILLVHDGMALNRPVAPYSTDSTLLSSSYCTVDTCRTVIENLHFYRMADATHKAYCIGLSNANNVLIRHIDIHTPKSTLTADAAISVSNCTNITLEDVVVDQTYSGKGKYGYALSFNNTWNSRFVRVEADGIWGVFGSNNMNNTTLINCDLNRFDIHCYGRDVLCKGCIFRQKQTQFSSFYGTLTFDSCQFIDCIPVRIRSSYNAYTPFDIVMRNCSFQATLRHRHLINVMLLDPNANRRPELSEKCWPNVSIENMEVVLPFGVNSFVLYDPTGTTSICKKQQFGYLSHIAINGLHFSKRKPTLYLSSRKVQMRQSVALLFNNVSPCKVVHNGLGNDQ